MAKLIFFFLKNIQSFQQALQMKGLPSAYVKNEISFLTLQEASSGLVQIENTPLSSASLGKGRLYGLKGPRAPWGLSTLRSSSDTHSLQKIPRGSSKER